MTDWINIRNLRIHGYHGVFDEEKTAGQEFQFDIDCAIDTSIPAQTDDYKKTVCYGALCGLVREICTQQPFRLVETLANKIADDILGRYDLITHIVVKVRKTAAPIDAVYDFVGVTVDKKRRRRIGLSLGSNLGEKTSYLRTALAHLATEQDLELDQVSSFYRTAPWGNTAQDWFVNVCVTGWTTKAPEDLLKSVKRIELLMGRIPNERWGPRIIDIDLLFMDDIEVNQPSLTLPHPELFNRPFVLVPLAEITPERSVGGRNIGEAADALKDVANSITRIDT